MSIRKISTKKSFRIAFVKKVQTWKPKRTSTVALRIPFETRLMHDKRLYFNQVYQGFQSFKLFYPKLL